MLTQRQSVYKVFCACFVVLLLVLYEKPAGGAVFASAAVGEFLAGQAGPELCDGVGDLFFEVGVHDEFPFAVVVDVVDDAGWYAGFERVFEHEGVRCCLDAVRVPDAVLWRFAAFEFNGNKVVLVAFESVDAAFEAEGGAFDAVLGFDLWRYGVPEFFTG